MKPDANIPFGRALRAARKAARLDMDAVAARLGCTVSVVSDVERGRSAPPDGVDLLEWFNILSIPADDTDDWLDAAARARVALEGPAPRPFAADTMRPDVSLPGEDPEISRQRARWMAAQHHRQGADNWDPEHPAPLDALHAWLDEGRALNYSDQLALLDEIEHLRGDRHPEHPGRWQPATKWLPEDGETVLASFGDDVLLVWRHVDEWFHAAGERHEAMTDAGGPDLYTPLPKLPNADGGG